MDSIIFLILGLIIGSFLNVVIYRLRTFDTIMGRSYCPHCKKQIRWYDNVPLLSFILLGAKCRDCEGKISWQYPMVELFTGIMFFLTGYYFFNQNNFSSYWETIFYLLIFSLFVVLFVYDWLYMEVPILLFWVVLGIVLIKIFTVFYYQINVGMGFFSSEIFYSLSGGFIAWILFFSLVFFSKEEWMGWGDVYIGLLLGLILGWPAVWLGLLISFCLGSVYSIGLMILKKANRKTQVPFVPFIALGTILTIFLTKEFPNLLNWMFFY